MQSKVNVFLIGAQKAGTTSLYEWLGQHSGVDAPREVKDYHFFTNESLYNKGRGHLDGFYRTEKPVKMHCAVNYLYFYDDAARRIFEYNQNAKIIICLRDPVARAISAYKYCIKTLREGKTFPEALRREIRGELSTFEERSDLTYIDHGRYVPQIEGYLKYFPKEQIHVLLFEELTDKCHRSKAIKSVLRFLDLDENYKFKFYHLNKSGFPRSSLLSYVVRKSFLRSILASILPLGVRRRIGHFINELNTSNKDIEVNIEKKDISMLRKNIGEVDFSYYEKMGVDASTFWRLGG